LQAVKVRRRAWLRSIDEGRDERGLAPNWLFKYVTKHVDGKSMNGKWIERELVTAASGPRRALPAKFGFQVMGQTSGSVFTFLYEMLIRTPMIREKYLEGSWSPWLTRRSRTPHDAVQRS